MKRPYTSIFLTSLFAIIHQLSIAQTQVQFKVAYTPGKTYKTSIRNSMNMIMDFTGDSVKLKEMKKQQGFPMIMTMDQDMEMTAKAGEQRPDKKVPLLVTYDKMSMKTKVNGKEMPITANPFANACIEALGLENGMMSIDSIKGDLAPDLKKTLEAVIGNIQNKVVFPAQALKIGESFTQELPITIPLPQTALKMIAKINYNLKEVRGTEALFDVTQSLSLDFSLEQGNVKGFGGGTGTLVYDMQKMYITKYDTDMKMDINFPMGEITMVAKSTTNSKLHVEIE